MKRRLLPATSALLATLLLALPGESSAFFFGMSFGFGGGGWWNPWYSSWYHPWGWGNPYGYGYGWGNPWGYGWGNPWLYDIYGPAWHRPYTYPQVIVVPAPAAPQSADK